MNQEELVRLQDTQFEILNKTAMLCTKYKIRYYLAYGTLLGAVRHKGTIPWDYDIDIFMDSENFNNFLKVSHELGEEYEIKKVGASKYSGISRIYKKNTLIYSEKHGKDEAFPIHIDIFKLEYAREYPLIVKKTINALSRFLCIAKLSNYEKGWLYERFKNNSKKLFIVHCGDILKRLLSEKQIEKLNHFLLVSKKQKKNYVLVHDSNKRYPVNYFKDGIKLQYENNYFVAPIEKEKLLSIMYGNYMKIPPEEERFTNEMDDLKIIF